MHPRNPPPIILILLVVVLTLFVGWLDFATGVVVRALPMYFAPLLWAAWVVPKRTALTLAGFSTLVWLVVDKSTNTDHTAMLYAVNTFLAGSSFVIVTYLVAWLREDNIREATLGRTDHLTGLLNRRAMEEIVGRELSLCKRYNRPASMLCIDLDNFKQVNDRQGHEHGDWLLRRCANLLSMVLRESDVIARYGGDEFVVFLPETDSVHAEMLAQRIRVAIDYAYDFRLAGVTVSVGAFSEQPVVSDIETMLKKADVLMYRDKGVAVA